jgi:plastocyanin
MRTRAGIVAFAAAAVTAVAPAAASAASKTVFADAPTSAQKVLSKYDASVNSFFQTRTTIHVGDTVKFIDNGFHTFDFPGTSGSDLPLIVGHGTVQGDKDAAGNLFWFNGKVPNLSINPALLAPIGSGTYDGSARADSGVPLGKPKPFKLTFTKAGTYKFYCDVHPGMVGFIVVKAKGKPIPTAKQDKAAIAKQVKADETTAKALFSTKPSAKNKVSLGESSKNGVEDYAMFPSKLKVKKGTVVTFFMSKATREDHTASFGPKAYLKSVASSITSPSPLQQAFYPSDDPALGPPLVTPTAHGNGFANTGVLDRDPTTTTIPASGKLKFTTAGTYHYICLIHPFMHGTIVVK